MTSYFKVPVDKLAAKIISPAQPNLKVEFNKSQMGMIEGLENHRFWVHISARRTGKSFAAAILAFAKILEPYQQVMVVAPNYSLSSIIWDYVKQFKKQLQIEHDRMNEKDKIIQLVNGSTFRLLSANNRDSLVGRAANLLIIDEAAVIDNDEFFTRDLRPALSTFEDSRCLFISTPRGRANYLYKYYLRGQDDEFPDWGSAVYDWTSNPLLSEKDIEEARHSNPEQVFLQEYYCKWTVFEGQVYSLNEEKHLKDLSTIIEPRDGRYDFIGGLDMGYRDATAFVVIATNGEEYFIVDEYISTQQSTSVHAAAIREKIDYWGIDNIYIDAAAAQTRADLAYEYDIYCDKAIKSVNDGIAFIQTLIEQDKLLLDENNAYETFKHLAAYRWNPKTETQKPLHDDHSHSADAVRYAIYSHSKTVVEIFTSYS